MGFVVAAAFFLALATTAVFAQPPVITAPEAAQKVASGEMILLDIRTPQEWEETGIAEGAWPVSMHTPDFATNLQSILSRFAPEKIGLICATGGRSNHVASILEKNGIVGVADVSEGMFGNGEDAGWISRGLPVVTLDEASANFDAARNDW